MRLITIILSLFFLENKAQALGTNHQLKVDSVKRLSKKHKHHKTVPLGLGGNIHYDDCAFTNKYSVKQRLLAYPYSKSVKILAVSYPCYCAVPNAGIIIDNPDGKSDTLDKPLKDTVQRTGLLVNNGLLDQSDIKEIKTLTQSQVNQLTKIIYNTGFKVHQYRELEPALFETGGGGCFNPRNAILFIDQNGKIFDYLEVCFECEVADSESHKITLGKGCNQKFELLRQYFISLGIKYGTINKD